MDRKTMQRIIVIILAAVLLLSIVAPVVMASEAETTAAPVSESKDATGEAEGGCASTVGGSALVASLLPLLFAAFLKKRDDER